jgi:predicted RNase H-like HicB family nuclease
MKLDTRSVIHLEWIFENQPQLVRDLHRSNKLEPHLDRKYQQALELTDKCKKAGQSEEEAFQNASDLILAPSNGPALSDNRPEPLPLEEQQAVYRRLEAIELAERKREERNQNPT